MRVPTIAAVVLTIITPTAHAHNGYHPVANWHKWESMQRECETNGFQRPWQYGPGSTEGRAWSGFYGGLQFSSGTWTAWRTKPYRYAHLAPKAVQIASAERLRRSRGLSPWPNCIWAWR